MPFKISLRGGDRSFDLIKRGTWILELKILDPIYLFRIIILFLKISSWIETLSIMLYFVSQSAELFIERNEVRSFITYFFTFFKLKNGLIKRFFLSSKVKFYKKITLCLLISLLTYFLLIFDIFDGDNAFIKLISSNWLLSSTSSIKSSYYSLFSVIYISPINSSSTVI